MTEPSPELEERVRLSFARLEPNRVFRGCEVAEQSGAVIVRIYSDQMGLPGGRPTPYQLFRFNSDTGDLSPLSSEDAAPFTIKNYK